MIIEDHFTMFMFQLLLSACLAINPFTTESATFSHFEQLRKMFVLCGLVEECIWLGWVSMQEALGGIGGGWIRHNKAIRLRASSPAPIWFIQNMEGTAQ